MWSVLPIPSSYGGGATQSATEAGPLSGFAEAGDRIRGLGPQGGISRGLLPTPAGHPEDPTAEGTESDRELPFHRASLATPPH